MFNAAAVRAEDEEAPKVLRRSGVANAMPMSVVLTALCVCVCVRCAQEESDSTKADDEEVDIEEEKPAKDIVATVYFPETPDKSECTSHFLPLWLARAAPRSADVRSFCGVCVCVVQSCRSAVM